MTQPRHSLDTAWIQSDIASIQREKSRFDSDYFSQVAVALVSWIVIKKIKKIANYVVMVYYK